MRRSSRASAACGCVAAVGSSIAVEIRQHDRAVLGARHGADEFGDGAIGAGGARHDRRAAGRQPRDLALDTDLYALGAIGETALAKPRRPRFEGDLQEIEGDLPVGVKLIANDIAQALETDAFDPHVVDQRGEIARQHERLDGRRRDERRLARIGLDAPVRADLPDGAFQRAAPGRDEPGERHPPLQITDRRPLVERERRDLGKFSLLDGEDPERDDARHGEAVAPASLDKRLAKGASGALRRQIERSIGERERIRPGKAGNQLSGKQRPRQRRQERCGSGYGEDARQGAPGLA
jgi:hypothetical protein